MREADARAVATWGVDTLVERAGYAVGATARDMLGTLYAKRIVIVAGPGLNGADGRRAGAWLTRRGAAVSLVDAASAPAIANSVDLVIDAAFGLGCSRPYTAPTVPAGTPVLSVDLPSGIASDSAEVMGEPFVADVTLALGALKPAHLRADVARYVGHVAFSSLGIETPDDSGVVETSDLDDFVREDRNDHKWKHAVFVVAGSPTMLGAPALALRGALATGASMIQLCVPGYDAPTSSFPLEIVRRVAKSVDVPDLVSREASRLRSVLVGPGLGRDHEIDDAVRELVRINATPMVLDADGLRALTPEMLSARTHPEVPIILTPHDGEFEALTGSAPSRDRVASVLALARASRCVVLAKGPTTIVASPDGRVRVVQSGTPALATAGTGDVLAGMIAGALSRGHEPLAAASLSAHLHGLAGQRLGAYAHADDLAGAASEVLRELRRAR